jgi:hypothetical protein
MMRSTVDHELRILNAECGRFSDAVTNEIEKLDKVTHVEANRDYLLQNIENYEVILIALRNTNEDALIEELNSGKVAVALIELLETIN